MGSQALSNNTMGSNNTAFGQLALFSNSTGYDNTIVGSFALDNNTFGNENTGVGINVLHQNSTGNNNTAVGSTAMLVNTIGYNNTALGTNALNHNTIGYNNTATGMNSLIANTIGIFNTGSGINTLYSNVSGNRNTAVGLDAMYNSTNGNNNTALGWQALNAITSGSNNTAIGANVNGASGIVNATGVGYNTTLYSNEILMGNASVSWIGGQVGWSTYSDERIKENIKENVPGLSFINQLRPVTYNLNIRKQQDLTNKSLSVTGSITSKEIDDFPGKYDIEKKTMTGFLAQEVESAAKKTGYDFSGVAAPANGQSLYSLQYAEFVVPIVKAIQEQQLMIESLKNDKEQITNDYSKKLELLQQQVDVLKKLVSNLK